MRKTFRYAVPNNLIAAFELELDLQNFKPNIRLFIPKRNVHLVKVSCFPVKFAALNAIVAGVFG